jgi:lipopolysaccharide biosynthesis regulator YciM
MQKPQQYYIDQLNPTCKIKVHEYLKLNMPWKEKHVLAQPRKGSHRQRCETCRWKEPEKEWDCETCQVWGTDEVET